MKTSYWPRQNTHYATGSRCMHHGGLPDLMRMAELLSTTAYTHSLAVLLKWISILKRLFKYSHDLVMPRCCDKLRMLRRRYYFITFLFVGGLNTCFGYLIFVLLAWIGLHFTLASLISTSMGILFNFKTTGSIVFRSHGGGRLPHFIGCYFVIYGANCLCLWALSKVGVMPVASAALLILPLAALAFVLQKRFVFPSRLKAPVQEECLKSIILDNDAA